jgi:hypothetical protein
MRKTLIVSVSAIAMLAASPQAFAGTYESVTKQQAAVTKQIVKPQAVVSNPNVVMPNRINKPGDGAMNVFKNTQTGGLPGGGVGGRFGSSRDQGAAILKGAGIKDGGLGRPGVPSGSLGVAKDQVGNIKGSVGQFQGRETSEGATVRQTEAMKKALGAAPGSKVVGVNPIAGATVRQTDAMKQALTERPGNQVVGVNPKDGDSKLSPEQRKALKDAVVNPGVNHDNKDKDVQTAKHLFDFVTPAKGFDWGKYEPPMPKPPKQ